MISFLNNKKVILTLLFTTFVCFVMYLLLGIFNIGYDSSHVITLYDCLGDIFVPIVGLLFCVLIPLTLRFYFDKLQYVRVHKFMSFLDYLGVFGVSLAQGILVDAYSFEITTLGVIVIIFIILTCVFSLLSALVCLFNLFTMPKYVSYKKTQRKRNMESDMAAQKLRTLKSMLDSGAITLEEYNEKKKKYIDLL